MILRSKELKEFPAMFIKKFKIVAIIYGTQRGYQINLPFEFFISSRNLHIYRSLNGLCLQNKQMIVFLSISTQTKELTAKITPLN